MVIFLPVSPVASIFAGENLRTLAVVVVVAVALREEPLLGTVEMLVHQVHLQPLHFGPEIIESLTLRAGAGGADNLDFGMRRADSLDERLEAGGIFRAPLLVADGDELQVEGFGMTHLGAEFAPLGIGAAVGKFNQIQRVLDIAAEVFDLDVRVLAIVLVLASQTAVQDRKRLGANLLRQLEEFEETHAVALEIVWEEAMREGIMPTVLVHRPVFDGADGVFPVIARGEVGSLDNAAAGEAEDTGFCIRQRLNQVFAQAILMSFPRIDREQGDMLQIHRTGGCQEDTQMRLRYRLRRSEQHLVLLPLRRVYFQILGNQNLRFLHRCVVNQLYADRLPRAASPDGETILRILLQTDAEETFVLDAGMFLIMSGVGEADVVRIALEGTVILHCYVPEDIPAHQLLGEVEGAVLD